MAALAPEKKVIAVTGASRGLGSAAARDLLRRGFTVACLSRAGRGPEDITCDTDTIARMIPISCDVTRPEDRKQAFATLIAKTQRLDGLVNNAGLHMEGASAEFSEQDFQALMHVNVTSLFAMSQEAYPHLCAAGGGLIVNLGSYYDKMGVKFTTAYCASKAAVAAISRCLAVEWAGDNIRVVTAAPGFIATDLNRKHMARERFRQYIARRVPGGKPGDPEEIGRFIGALFAENFKFLTGETLYIDGGQSIAN